MLVLLVAVAVFCGSYLGLGLMVKERARARAPDGGIMSDLARSKGARRVWKLAVDVRSRIECLVSMPKATRGVGQDVPEMLDIVGLGLTAGLSFDAALAEYCHESVSGLARGLESAMLSWQMGLASRHDALVKLSKELGEASIARFAASVTEALELGTPLVATLERQAKLARDEQRSQVEERIEKVPVKMLVPMGTLVVPAMLLGILGPLVAGLAR